MEETAHTYNTKPRPDNTKRPRHVQSRTSREGERILGKMTNNDLPAVSAEQYTSPW